MSDDPRDLLGAYALNALGEEERAQVEAYVATDPAAARELRSLMGAAAQYGASAAVTPPDWMRQAVLDRVAADANVDEVPRSEAGPARERARQRWFAWAGGAVAAATTAAAIALGVSLADTREELAAVRADQAYVVEIAAQPDADIVALRPDEGRGNVVVSRSAGAAAFVAAGLEPLEGEQTYQLWVIGGERIESAGTFAVDTEGSTGVLVAEGIENADALAVSVEPAGGSEQPTTDPILVAELPG